MNGCAKLAYWTNKMAFQHTVAGSNNVDVYVYIIGVQTNDNATNDFLSSAYTFTITIATTSVEKGTA